MGWALIQIDGQRLVVTGTPPDAERASGLIRKLAAIEGVIEVVDQLSTPMETSPPTAEPGTEIATLVEPLMDTTGVAPLTEEFDPVPDAANGSMVGEPDDGPIVAAETITSDTASNEPHRSADVQLSASVPTSAESTELLPVDPIIQAAEAGPGRPLLSEPLARCQREIDAMLTGSASFFTSASSEITAEALPIVDQMAALLADCNARAEIAGHTDNSGRTRPNLQLSQARADAIRAHLIVKGVPEMQLSAIGFGEERPIVSNRTPEGRRQNRRIEVRIVDDQISTLPAAPTGNRS